MKRIFIIFLILILSYLQVFSDNMDNLISNAVENMENSVPDNMVIGVGKIVYSDNKLGSEFSNIFKEKLIIAILRSEKYELSDMDNLESIKEQWVFQRSGNVHEDQAVRMAGLNAVQALLLGKYYDTGNTVTVFLRLLDVESGEILAAEEIVISKRDISVPIILYNYSDTELSNNSESSTNNKYLDVLAENSESEIIEYNSDSQEDYLIEIESEIPELRNDNITSDNTTNDIVASETGENVTIYLIIAVLTIALIIVLLIYRTKSSGNIDRAVKKTANKKKIEGKSQQIEMRVKMQNPKIGYRNIHQIGRDNYKSIGGGKSAFLIFFIKFPSHIAEVHWNGKDFTFVPVRTDFFPELKGPVKKCLNKDILALSKKGHRIIINFNEYISPLDKINSIFSEVIHS